MWRSGHRVATTGGWSALELLQHVLGVVLGHALGVLDLHAVRLADEDADVDREVEVAVEYADRVHHRTAVIAVALPAGEVRLLTETVEVAVFASGAGLALGALLGAVVRALHVRIFAADVGGEVHAGAVVVAALEARRAALVRGVVVLVLAVLRLLVGGAPAPGVAATTLVVAVAERDGGHDDQHHLFFNASDATENPRQRIGLLA